MYTSELIRYTGATTYQKNTLRIHENREEAIKFISQVRDEDKEVIYRYPHARYVVREWTRDNSGNYLQGDIVWHYDNEEDYVPPFGD